MRQKTSRPFIADEFLPKAEALTCALIDLTDAPMTTAKWISVMLSGMVGDLRERYRRRSDRQWPGPEEERGDWNATTDDEERFPQLVVCARSSDRFRAMEIRHEQGIKAAIKFIRQCEITDEAP